MFGPFNGPFPAGRYAIRKDGNAVNLTSVISNAVVNMLTIDDKSEYQMWDFEYGQRGYRIKNVASETFLSYAPWAVPSKILNQPGSIVAAGNTAVEWGLVQTSLNFSDILFQFRVISGTWLEPTDNFSLYSNGYLALNPSGSSSSFYIHAMDTVGPLGVKTLSPEDNKTYVIRSAFDPQLALDAFKGGKIPGSLVLTNKADGRDSETWLFTKGSQGFKINNLQTRNNLGAAVVPGTPSTYTSVVCQDTKPTEWLLVPSSHGFELCLASNSTSSIRLWNTDAAKNGWLYIYNGTTKENPDTAQQWILLQPGAVLEGDGPKPRMSEKNIHIVTFKFTSSTSESSKLSVAKAFLALKTECVSPSTGKPYILSLNGGRNDSKEGFDEGLEYAFVLEFATEADRQHYLNTDMAHAKFKKILGPQIVKPEGDSFIFDFIPEVFDKRQIGASTGSPPQPVDPATLLNAKGGSNLHLAAFKYTSSTSEATKLSVAKAFLALKTQCVSPSTGRPYILSLEGGVGYSIAGADKKFDHAFVVEFATDADRQYYLKTDPAHAQFKKLYEPLVADDGTPANNGDILVLDFVPGVFDKSQLRP
ncbi:hypothetical protein FRB94_009333 [Tulasnella sp. JGI-2019a]|nr:hypothetical protein FRB94_009333 [Tulasnella sp. JGI-2019a]